MQIDCPVVEFLPDFSFGLWSSSLLTCERDPEIAPVLGLPNW